jgi:hypothetical protein
MARPAAKFPRSAFSSISGQAPPCSAAASISVHHHRCASGRRRHQAARSPAFPTQTHLPPPSSSPSRLLTPTKWPSSTTNPPAARRDARHSAHRMAAHHQSERLHPAAARFPPSPARSPYPRLLQEAGLQRASFVAGRMLLVITIFGTSLGPHRRRNKSNQNSRDYRFDGVRVFRRHSRAATSSAPIRSTPSSPRHRRQNVS